MARDYAYTTNPEHRILGLTESVAGSTSAAWTYGYDLADRLLLARDILGWYFTAYDLDAADNLLQIQNIAGITTTTYDSLNRIALRNGQPFVYDTAGNLTDDGQRTYVWDAEQRLIRIGYTGYTGTNKSTEFRYDGLGRRIAVREYSGTPNYTETRYLWCGERICQARNGSDTVIRRYYDEGEQLVTANGNTSYYYAQDHLGSVRDLVNASGMVLASYDYDPYGNPTRATQNGSARADYRYAGLFYHAASGLYLTHYRAYSPTTARWLSRDPIGETRGINLYGYVGGNPIDSVDPTGEIAFVPVAVGIGIGLAFDYVVSKWKEEHCKCDDASTAAGAAGNAVAGGAVGGSGPFATKPRGGVAGGGRSGTATSTFSQINHAAASRGWYSVGTRNAVTKVLRKVPYAGIGLAAYEVYDAFSCD